MLCAVLARMSYEDCGSDFRCLKRTCKCCKAVSWIWSILVTTITIIVLYYLSGVHDVAYVSSQLKGLNISGPPQITGFQDISPNASVVEKAKHQTKEALQMLKGVRKLFDSQMEVWDPAVPENVKSAEPNNAMNVPPN